MSPTIPTSGRIGKLAKMIEEETSKEITEDLFQDYSNSLKGEGLAKWVLDLIDKLKSIVGLENTIDILEKDRDEKILDFLVFIFMGISGFYSGPKLQDREIFVS